MRYHSLFVLLSALTVIGPTAAQTKTTDPYASVRGWYQQYLEREVDPAGMAGWTDHLRGGKPGEWVLAHILASDEYFQRAGATPEGFVRAFFLDATGQAPPAREQQEWAQRMRGQDRHALAQAMIQRYPQALQPVAEPAERHYLGTARGGQPPSALSTLKLGVAALARVRESRVLANAATPTLSVDKALATELERLQEEVVAELSGQKERELYRRIEIVIGDLRHFQRSLKGGVKRENLYEDFAKMDRKLHELEESIRALGANYRSLQRVLHRVSQADQQLHAALSIGDTSPERGREVVRRQTQALLAETQELQRTARYALVDNREGRQAEASVGKFTEAVQHFHKSLEKGLDGDHLRQDYAAVDKAWAQLINQLNDIPPREGNIHLRRLAQRVDGLHDQVARQLGVESSRRRIVLPYSETGR